jgi:curli biogenesis system outer membrane secretion channel CsgG
MNLPLPPYSGSKARLAVSSFTLKAAKATAEIGTGLREMFVSALTQSNRFVVSERAETAGQRPADLAVVVAVTQFEPQSSGGRAGIGGGGGAGSGVLGSLIGSSGNAAQLALELRIIDPVTSDVISQTVVKGQALDATGGVLQGVFGGWSLGAGLSAYANTPMEKAVRTCIIDAVRYVSDAVPSGYYRE